LKIPPIIFLLGVIKDITEIEEIAGGMKGVKNCNDSTSSLFFAKEFMV
jgi:hypothetical protein